MHKGDVRPHSQLGGDGHREGKTTVFSVETLQVPKPGTLNGIPKSCGFSSTLPGQRSEKHPQPPSPSGTQEAREGSGF